MLKLIIQYHLSFLLPILFFFSPACNSGGQSAAITAIEEDRLPTRRELRNTLRKKKDLLVVYPSGEKNEHFYQTRIDALNKNERFGLQAKGISLDKLTKIHLEKEVIFMIGNIGTSALLKEFATSLPIQLSETAFTFDNRTYQKEATIFKLFPYPNPFNQSLPFYLLTGNSDVQIRQYLANNYPIDLSRMLWSSWGYEVHQDGEMKVAGYLNETNWELDKQIHFDFSRQNDTVFQSTHFRFIAHSSPLTKNDINNIAEKCEVNYQRITDFVDQTIQLPKINYHFYPSVENKGLQKSNMNEASTDMETNSIEVVMNDNFKGSYQHPENKLLFRSTLGKPYLLALEEGLSIHFTEKWQNKGYNFWTKKLFLSDNLPPLKELISNEWFEKESHLVMGAMAGTFVDFLIDKFGKNGFLDHYNIWEYKDFETLENEWNTYLASKFKEDDKRALAPKITKMSYLKGFNFAHEGYRVYNGYGSQLAKESLQRLSDIGTNAIALVPYSFMRNPNKPSYIPVHYGAGGENDQAVLFSHFEAKKMRMHTMLKPQIWLGRSWPGEVEMKNEKDWTAFFDYYYRWVRHYALLAEINGVGSYCIGVEFAKATLAKEQEWRSLIKKLRGIYSGPLTYAANWGEEFEQLKFWDELDFIGLNCYYPLSKNDKPSKRELSKSFNQVMDKIELVCKKYNKPLIFTEIGFRSVEGTWKNPHEEANGRSFNDAHQNLCYEVVLEGIQNKKWCNGILWWKWPSYISYRGQQNTGFSPNLKQTENIINKYFKTKY